MDDSKSVGTVGKGRLDPHRGKAARRRAVSIALRGRAYPGPSDPSEVFGDSQRISNDGAAHAGYSGPVLPVGLGL